MNPLDTLLLTALAPLAWGTTYLVTTELLPPGHPLFAGLMRALPAGLLAIAIGRRLPRGGWWLKAAVLGILNIGAFFPLLFLAAERLPGGVAAAPANPPLTDIVDDQTAFALVVLIALIAGQIVTRRSARPRVLEPLTEPISVGPR